MNLFIKIFSIKNKLNKEEIEGEIPRAKELYSNYWKVAGPAAIEGVFLNLMLLADLVMVGQLGIAQAAAIGIVSQPKMIIQMIGKSLGTGVTAVVGRRKGEDNKSDLNNCIKQSILLTTLIYVVIVAIANVFKKSILLFMGADIDYIGYAETYFSYLTLALFFKALSAILTASQVGIGNTKIILKASMIGNSMNVIFNYILIFGKFGFPRLEIKGAAIATIIGEAVIFIILLTDMLFRKSKDINLIREGTFKISKRIMSSVIDVASNSLFEQIFERIGLVIFARLIAELGTIAVGTHHYCIIIWDLYYYFGLGLGTASSSFSSRMIGAKRKDLAKLYVFISQRFGLVSSIVVSIVMLLFRHSIFGLMINDVTVVLLGANVMIIIAIILIPQVQAQVLSGTLRGAGDNRFIAIYSLFISAILRSILAYIFAFKLNLYLYGIWLALFIDESLKMILSKYRVSKGIWLAKKI